MSTNGITAEARAARVTGILIGSIPAEPAEILFRLGITVGVSALQFDMPVGPVRTAAQTGDDTKMIRLFADAATDFARASSLTLAMRAQPKQPCPRK